MHRQHSGCNCDNNGIQIPRESLFVKIKLNQNDKLLVGII